MWIYDFLNPEDNPYKDPPYVAIEHISYIDNLPQWQYPFHRHEDCYELAWIMRGRGHLVLDDRRLPIEEGSVTAMPPGIPHYFSAMPGQGICYYTLRFPARKDHSELQTYFAGLGVAAAADKNRIPYILQTWKLLFDLQRENGGIADATFQTIALGLIHLAKLVFSQQTTPINVEDHEIASRIMDYIMKTSGVGITLESLAKTFSISPSHLSRIFSAAYHVSPINYAINARITYSTEYLLRTDLSVAEIAEKMGYDNPTHFSNMFIKRIGCTPTEFRERNRRIPNVE